MQKSPPAMRMTVVVKALRSSPHVVMEVVMLRPRKEGDR